MIYFETNVQLRVIKQFQFALKPNGYLFLGPSESLGPLSRDFETVDNHSRIFRKTRDAVMGSVEPLSFLPNRLSIRDRSALAMKRNMSEDNQIVNLAYESLLVQYMPPSVVINEDLELLHCFGDARLLLQVPVGKTTLNICRMLEPELSAAVGLLVSQTKSRAESNLGRVSVLFKDNGRSAISARKLVNATAADITSLSLRCSIQTQPLPRKRSPMKQPAIVGANRLSNSSGDWSLLNSHYSRPSRS